MFLLAPGARADFPVTTVRGHSKAQDNCHTVLAAAEHPSRGREAHEIWLREIAARPDDDTLRLVYADWLEENGNLPLAQFIRTQIRLHDLLRTASPNDPEALRLAAMERSLLDANARQWLPRRIVERNWSVTFRRGFIDEITLPLSSVDEEHALPLFQQIPTLRFLVVQRPKGDSYTQEGVERNANLVIPRKLRAIVPSFSLSVGESREFHSEFEIPQALAPGGWERRGVLLLANRTAEGVTLRVSGLGDNVPEGILFGVFDHAGNLRRVFRANHSTSNRNATVLIPASALPEPYSLRLIGG